MSVKRPLRRIRCHHAPCLLRRRTTATTIRSMSSSNVDDSRPYRLGVLIPSSNTKAEPAIQSILERINAYDGRPIHAHYTRVRVTQISLDGSSTSQFDIKNMLQAASLLADAGVHAIAWAGTSAGWLGIENDRSLCAAVTKRFGVPATTTTLALLEYMHAHTDTKLLLVTPFVYAINEAIRANFVNEGVEVVDDRCLSYTDNTVIGRLPDRQIEYMVEDVTRLNPDINAVTVFCTNLYIAPEVGAGWEDNFALIDSIVVTIWELLGKLGTEVPGRVETDLQRLMVDSFQGNMFASLHTNGDHSPDR